MVSVVAARSTAAFQSQRVPTVVHTGRRDRQTPMPGRRDITECRRTCRRSDVATRPRQARSTPSVLSENGRRETRKPAANPWQQDLLYRGFIVSPLLGTPQGVSVYQDGVRVNEPFGDGVNWDLLPTGAIASMQILPGSNPVFGLNTLGGSILVQTRRGDRFPGVELEASAGSFGSRQASITAGGRTACSTASWRPTPPRTMLAEHNASRVRQLLRTARRALRAYRSAICANCRDTRSAASRRSPGVSHRPKEAYTWPDENRNRLALVPAKLAHHLDDTITLSGHLYGRRSTHENVSSNVNDEFDDADDPEAFTIAPPSSRQAGERLCSLAGAYDLRNSTPHRVRGHDGCRSCQLQQDTQPATFTADRGTIATGPFES